MEKYKEEFIHFMIDCEVLRFGDFVTKSGRNTPFFINTGFYRTGSQLKRLGQFYAEAIVSAFGQDISVLFGPAYKGIPLSVATSIALYDKYGIEVKYAANRKEEKDHGEGGKLLGGPIGEDDRVVIIEDVTTAGTSIRETVPIIKAAGAKDIVGLCVSVDRMERGTEAKSALAEIEDNFGIKTTAIVNMQDVVDCLHNNPYNGREIIDDAIYDAIKGYYEQYGVQ